MENIESFIEYGFARTKSISGRLFHTIDEPLAIMAAWHWLHEKNHFSLLNHLQRGIGKHASRKNGFEAYFAFFIRTVFEKAPRLDNVFVFRSDFARRMPLDLPWLSEEFELVTVSKPSDANERKISVVTPSCGPAAVVGFRALNDQDIFNWISENKENYAFCFPTEKAGPDLFFYIRSKKTQELLLVAVQAKNYQHVENAILIHGVRTVTPSWFWKSKDLKVHHNLHAT
jgi:hypothetical protein